MPTISLLCILAYMMGGFAGKQLMAEQGSLCRTRPGQMTMRLFDHKKREIKFIEDLVGLRKYYS